MKIKTILVSLVTLAVLSEAQTCTYSQKGQVDVGFKAFKTPLKIGVGGSFKEVAYTTNVQGANSLDGLLVGSTLMISKSSVDTKNPGRDKTLSESFFNVLKGDQISAKVLEIKEDASVAKMPHTGILTARITLNDVTVKVPFRYTIKAGVMSGKGTIDLYDFKALPALESINKSCFELHKGKTWADVDLSFTMNIVETCK